MNGEIVSCNIGDIIAPIRVGFSRICRYHKMIIESSDARRFDDDCYGNACLRVERAEFAPDDVRIQSAISLRRFNGNKVQALRQSVG